MRLNSELTIVTAASSGHFRSLLQFLQSVKWYEPSVPCVVFSLGLSENEIARLKRRFPGCTLRYFEFEKYPAHYDMNIDNGAYAWKPAIVWEVLSQSDGVVCWMDAGNVLTSDLHGMIQAIRDNGFYCPYSPGTIQEWTHPGMLSFLGMKETTYGSERNLNGACMGFDPDNEEALKLAERWAEYARIPQCIAPAGSNRHNHRYDQALLSLLSLQVGLARSSVHSYLGFKPHQDAETYPIRAFLRKVRRTVEYWIYRTSIAGGKA